MDVASLQKRPVNRPSPNMAKVAVCHAAYFGVMGATQEASDHLVFPRTGLPDTFNIGDHIGNVPVSSVGATLVTYALLESARRVAMRRHRDLPTANQAGRAGILIGALTGLMLNGFVETKTGLRIDKATLNVYLNSKGVNGGDLRDFAYGETAAMLTGALAGRVYTNQISPLLTRTLAT